MVVIYPVIFTKTNDEKDTYLIEIPDLKGMTEGYGLADAIKMARDYIGCYCYDKADADMPVASSLNDVDVDGYRKKMSNRAVRRNVSIPFWLNEAANKQHINVSKVLQEALTEKLNMA